MTLTVPAAQASSLAPPRELQGMLGRLAKLATTAAVRQFLRRQPGLLRPETVEQLSDAVTWLVHVDLVQAERLAQAARVVADRLQDDYCRARALRTSAHILFSKGRYVDAIDGYEAAVTLFEALGKPLEIGRTLSSSLQPLIYLGRFQEAEVRAGRARRLFEQANDRVRVARLDGNLGNILYRQDRFREAWNLYKRAYEELRGQGADHDVAQALHNMAVCHISLNQFTEALQTYRECRAYSEQHGLPLLVMKADYNVAYLYYLRGEYTRAIELYKVARARAEELKDAYHMALCDLDQSELYLELNLTGDAVDLAQAAFAGFDALKMGYEAAKALTHIGIGAARTGEAFRALELMEKAREIFAREKNRVWPAVIDAYKALVLHQEGRHFEARRLADAALRFFSAAGFSSKAAFCELLLARIHLWTGELVSAKNTCAGALERLDETAAPELTYRAYVLLGEIEEALGNREAAFSAYRSAHARLENLRSHLQQDEMKIGFLKDKLTVYESLVWMTLAGDHGPAELNAALGYIEQAKSRSLADLMAFRAHALPARAPAHSGLVERVHALRKELNWYYRKIDLAEIRPEAESPERIQSLRAESRERETRLLRTLRDLRNEDQEFAAIQGACAVSLEAVRSTLPADAVLLEYYEARGTVVAVLLTRESLKILPLTPSSRARRGLRLLRFQLSKFRLGAEYVREFADRLLEATCVHLRDLHAELFAPLRQHLDGRRLIVAPHGFLHYVPFQALFDGRAYVIDQFEVSYVPSASVHHLCSKKPQGWSDHSLVMGVPDAATPHILNEVRAVSSALPNPRLLIGEMATEEALRLLGRRARFVHIATHGHFRYDNPMFSSVQLGNSRLSLFDLYQLELGAEMVTLSGCGTGLSVAEGGDEIIGLVRGLLYAGAHSTLVTLWDVNDRTTSKLMKDFYDRLRTGTGKALALREAMLQLRKKYPHPYYWAPFILVGAA